MHGVDKAIHYRYSTMTVSIKLPMGLLHDEYIDGYECEDGISKVTYSNGTVLTYNEEKDDISIKTTAGTYYTNNGNTLVEGFKDDEYLCYTKSGNFLYDIPFENKIEKIIEIDFEGEKEEMLYDIKENQLVIHAKPDTAFKIILK